VVMLIASRKCVRVYIANEKGKESEGERKRKRRKERLIYIICQ
jgi:hypothetical protein